MRHGIIASMFGLMLIAWTAEARAQPEWFTCEIVSTGVTKPNNTDPNGIVIIRLTDTATPPAFTNMAFRASEEVENRMLATALSALTADLKVMVRADISSAMPDIIVMHAKNL